jgi:hypothetical protein
MTTDDKNRYLCQKLGLCWHEQIYYEDGYKCLCGFTTKYSLLYEKHEIKFPNPNFSDDAGTVKLLREMMKRDDWDEFIVENGCVSKYGRHFDTILVQLITTSGALLDACIEWFKRREK